ncbi:leucine-rich repeat flightless-interacting protein 2-like isoform X13 [Oncorhynchus masou masou]|uniref:leucine-rich repeat flightless-interacting protein 2-like isoform X13 n=1 Tax=Oncorhynchus masou masou TaxID=90313 RepID=UPI00318465E7
MGTQGTGRKRNPNKDRSTAEDDALNLISREAEARLAAKRAARAEAREIRMKELERQQKEIYQVQKKYYGLDNKSDKIDSEWGHIEQWMEDSERYSRPTQRHTSISDDDERMSVGSRGSVRDKKSKKKKKHKDRDSSRLGDESTSRVSRSSRLDLQPVEDRDYLEKGSRAASTLSAATLASLGGSSSRGESGETSITGDTETSIREIKEIHELKDQIQDVESKYMQSLKEVKDTLVEVEEKYRKAMVSNAQLDNEKNNLMYQVDTLKDSLMELEELLSESRREYEGKSKDFEREKHAHGVLQFQFKEMKETLKQSEELLTEIRQMRLKQDGFVREISDLQETVEWKDKKIGALERQKEYSDAIRNERDELRDEVVQLKDILKKHGIVLRPDLTANGETLELGTEGSASGDPASQLAQDSQTSPLEGGNSMLEIRLRKLVDERENLIGQVKKLKAQVEQKKQRNEIEEDSSPEGEVLENGTDPHIQDLQRDASRQLSDLKFKLVKSEQEVTALEQNVTRLEGQVTRYKGASENSEKVEDELKAEKRKLQRELRSALDKIDELESNNSHLSKRLDKMKANRSTATTP